MSKCPPSRAPSVGSADLGPKKAIARPQPPSGATRSRPRWPHLAGLILVCLAATRAWSAMTPPAPVPATPVERRSFIAAMSASERVRLERNLQEFQKLSDAERESLRHLEQDLQDDDRKGGTLRTVMHQYSVWLSTLDSGKREALRAETDPHRRAEKVRALRAEQAGESKGLPLEPVSPKDALSAADLAAVLGELERIERLHLRPGELSRLDPLRGMSRYVQVLVLARRNDLQGRLRLLGDDLPQIVAALVEQVSNVEQKTRLQQVATPREQFAALTKLIRKGLIAQMQHARPTSQQLQAFFLTLDPAARDAIERAPTEQFRQKLTAAYMDAHPDLFVRMKDEGFINLDRWLKEPDSAAGRAGRRDAADHPLGGGGRGLGKRKGAGAAASADEK